MNQTLSAVVVENLSTDDYRRKLPMTEVMGFPPQWGFSPRPVRRHRRVARRQFAGTALFCAVLGYSQPGSSRPRVWSHGEALSPASTGDGPTHTALIQRDLPALHRHSTRREWRGVIRSAVRGLPTEARVSGPIWTTHTIMVHAPKQRRRIDSKPPAGQSAVARSASDALPPTRERVGFRAVQL